MTPLPPLTNRIWRRGWKWLRNGRRMPVTYKSAEARAWQSTMGWQLRCALPRWSEAERQADWAVQIWLYFPDARRRDPDGPIKLLLDTLAAAIGCDDRHLLPQVIGRTIDQVAPRVELALERLPASAVAAVSSRRRRQCYPDAVTRADIKSRRRTVPEGCRRTLMRTLA